MRYCMQLNYVEKSTSMYMSMYRNSVYVHTCTMYLCLTGVHSNPSGVHEPKAL